MFDFLVLFTKEVMGITLVVIQLVNDICIEAVISSRFFVDKELIVAHFDNIARHTDHAFYQQFFIIR